MLFFLLTIFFKDFLSLRSFVLMSFCLIGLIGGLISGLIGLIGGLIGLIGCLIGLICIRACLHRETMDFFRKKTVLLKKF